MAESKQETQPEETDKQPKQPEADEQPKQSEPENAGEIHHVHIEHHIHEDKNQKVEIHHVEHHHVVVPATQENTDELKSPESASKTVYVQKKDESKEDKA